MITIDIPGFRILQLAHLVLDYNGTIAVDGKLIPGVADTLRALASQLQIHVITADTFGGAQTQLDGLPITFSIIPQSDQAAAKAAYISALGADTVVAIGNGRNDRDMLKDATLGIALIQTEGAAAHTLVQADVICTSILDALNLLHHPKRLVATLRS